MSQSDDGIGVGVDQLLEPIAELLGAPSAVGTWSHIVSVAI
ncbi:hypothetical protein QP907_06500 [Corynebacterium pseudodiphtheriticum]|nr:hypothetical protein [Corynebacterium pseudodiphtheriticum]MDK8551963.1 hypothetical protein [Corynebacterium pseudodiphtheriticum]